MEDTALSSLTVAAANVWGNRDALVEEGKARPERKRWEAEESRLSTEVERHNGWEDCSAVHSCATDVIDSNELKHDGS